LPTHFDLIPGTVLEAMFIGTPVVAYASGGLPELNQETETLRLVETGNVGSLAKEILALLANQTEREKLSEKAREMVNRRFDNELIFQDMMNAYRSVIINFSK
jgi:glycosyltransferase involved in cell wall biosynthesis